MYFGVDLSAFYQEESRIGWRALQATVKDGLSSEFRQNLNPFPVQQVYGYRYRFIRRLCCCWRVLAVCRRWIKQTDKTRQHRQSRRQTDRQKHTTDGQTFFNFRSFKHIRESRKSHVCFTDPLQDWGEPQISVSFAQQKWFSTHISACI